MSSAGQALSVLLVEDDPSDVAFLRTVFDGPDWTDLEYEHVTRLSEALQRLEADPNRIVVLDLVLPDTSGIEAVRTVVEFAPQTPVVVLTKLADETMALAALRAGAQDYLVKGRVDRLEVIRALQFGAERHRVQRALAETTDQLRAANERLSQLTVVDPLTEVFDRRGLQRVLEREIKWARRTGTSLLALLVDIDDFDVVNRTHGRSTGDRVLRDVARAIQASIRVTDPVGRIDEDEFLVLLPDTDLTEGCLVADRVRLASSGNRRHGAEGDVSVTVSLGLASVPDEAGDLQDVLAAVGLHLARSKRDGKNRVSWPGPLAGMAMGGRRTISNIVERIRGGSVLRPVLQQIVHLESGRIAGYEALMRTTLPGAESPQQMFALCAEAGLVTVVDRQCFESCIGLASRIDGDLKVHINLLPSTLVDLPPEALLRAFPEHRPPSAWCVEISEQRLPRDPFEIIDAVETLKERGLSVAIDDIGHGHSSFESLVVLEPDIFKLDKRLVTGVGRSGDTRKRVVERILSVAHTLNAEVVAEGVETAEDVESLKRLGVEYGQGFFWGQPG